MKEAIEILKKLRDQTQAEKWHDEAAQRNLISGIVLCISKLETVEALK